VGNLIRFKSLGNPKIAYAWGYSSEAYFGDRGFSRASFRYDTYGDGMIQHSPFYRVSPDDAVDYLLSMARFLLDHPEDRDINSWLGDWDYQLFTFLQKLRHKEGKALYYSKSERKVTSAPAKQFDKRYEEVPEWADGLFGAVFRLCREDYFDPLTNLALAVQLRNWFGKMFNDWPWVEQIAGFNEKHEFRYLRDAYEAVDNLKRSAWIVEASQRRIESYERQIAESTATEGEAQ